MIKNSIAVRCCQTMSIWISCHTYFGMFFSVNSQHSLDKNQIKLNFKICNCNNMLWLVFFKSLSCPADTRFKSENADKKHLMTTFTNIKYNSILCVLFAEQKISCTHAHKVTAGSHYSDNLVVNPWWAFYCVLFHDRKKIENVTKSIHFRFMAKC